MGNALAALLYLGFGAGWSLVASNVRKNRSNQKRSFISNMIAGSTGAWLGATLFGPVGPSIYGVSLLATGISSLGAVFGFNMLSRKMENNDDRQQEN